MPTESSGSTGKNGSPDLPEQGHRPQRGGAGSSEQVSHVVAAPRGWRGGYRKTGAIATKIRISANVEYVCI